MEISLLVGFTAAGSALLRGGSLRSLLETSLRRAGLLVLALATQLVFVVSPPAWLTRPWALAIYLGTQLMVGAFLWSNRGIPGINWVTVGLALNVLVIAANGAMPVSEKAARIAGTEFLTDHRHVKHGLHLRNEAMDASTRLAFLSDVVPVPVLEKVLSGGDLVIALGIGLLVYRRTRPVSVASPSPHAA